MIKKPSTRTAAAIPAVPVAPVAPVAAPAPVRTGRPRLSQEEMATINFRIPPSYHNRIKRKIAYEMGDELGHEVRFQDILRLGLALVVEAWGGEAMEGLVPEDLLAATLEKIRK